MDEKFFKFKFKNAEKYKDKIARITQNESIQK